MKSIRAAVRITLGFVVLLAGLILALPGVPGPGIVVMIVGLVILADHFHWARRTLDWAKRKAEQARDRVRGGRL
ncbi:MAG: PGPGW domain-containing protein [Acidobacteria bacterium]|nr:PGPGW domain-containing protein [Acidobacteriota bacterium]